MGEFKDRIAAQSVEALKAGEKVRLGTLRLLSAAIKNQEVEVGHELDDAEVQEIAGREAKKRKESIEAFGNAGRQDLVDKEEAELAILREFLPTQLSDADVDAIVDEAIELFKKGDLDYYFVNISQVWVQDLNTPNFQRGLILKRKVFNNYPQSTQFMAFNTRRAPWDDIRVRKAFVLLLNRQLLIDTLFFKEYQPLNSTYPGTEYENPNNPKNPYDPQQALALLGEAGWKDRDAQGRLTKNGQPLQVERDAARGPEQHPQGSAEELALDQDPRLDAVTPGE
jgi:uncharacterized protein YqeY